MKPKRVNVFQLLKLFKEIRKGTEASVGNYLYKTLRVQVSRYKLTPSQMVSQLYNKRRSQGLCAQCGKEVKERNPRTGKMYRMCRFHRNKANHRKARNKRS